MKHLTFLLIICIVFSSCEKSVDNLYSNFNHKILAGYFVTSIAFDSKGNTWIGTFEQGLIKYNSTGTYVYNSSNSIVPSTSVINDIAIDSKDNVWIGCDELIKYDGSTFTQYNSTNTPIPEDNISSIAIDTEDNIWFTSSRFEQGGVVMYDGTNWNVYTPDNSDLPVNLTKSIAIDNNDNVWIALSGGVDDPYLAKISENKWQIYTSDDLGFSPYNIGNIRINSQNKVCGSIDYSLSSIAHHNGPKVFIFDGESSEELQLDNISNIKSITVDNNDNIWCIDYYGFLVYNGDNWYTNNFDFNGNSIFVIEQAPDNYMWIGTDDGIYIYPRINKR